MLNDDELVSKLKKQVGITRWLCSVEEINKTKKAIYRKIMIVVPSAVTS